MLVESGNEEVDRRLNKYFNEGLVSKKVKEAKYLLLEDAMNKKAFEDFRIDEIRTVLDEETLRYKISNEMGVILESSYTLKDKERDTIKKKFFETKSFNEAVKAVINNIAKLEEIQREVEKSNNKFALRDKRRDRLF